MIRQTPSRTSRMQQRRITARRSSVHGKGLFALRPIAAGERLIEYRGELTTWRRAAARQRADAGHTFVFGLSDGRVIDGSRGGNSARFLNHACARTAKRLSRVIVSSSTRSPTSRPAANCLLTMRWSSTANPPMRSGNSTHAAVTRPGADGPRSARQVADVGRCE